MPYTSILSSCHLLHVQLLFKLILLETVSHSKFSSLNKLLTRIITLSSYFIIYKFDENTIYSFFHILFKNGKETQGQRCDILTTTYSRGTEILQSTTFTINLLLSIQLISFFTSFMRRYKSRCQLPA